MQPGTAASSAGIMRGRWMLKSERMDSVRSTDSVPFAVIWQAQFCQAKRPAMRIVRWIGLFLMKTRKIIWLSIRRDIWRSDMTQRFTPRR